MICQEELEPVDSDQEELPVIPVRQQRFQPIEHDDYLERKMRFIQKMCWCCIFILSFIYFFTLFSRQMH